MSAELQSLLAPDVPWQKCYAGVAIRAREVLKGRQYPLSTAGLVEALYPLSSVEGSQGIAARARLFAALAALVTHDLACYARRGDPQRKRYPMRGGWRFVTNTPWLWADYGSPNDEAKPRCPACGRSIKREVSNA